MVHRISSAFLYGLSCLGSTIAIAAIGIYALIVGVLDYLFGGNDERKL